MRVLAVAADSAAALSLLQNRFPQAASDTATIVFWIQLVWGELTSQAPSVY